MCYNNGKIYKKRVKMDAKNRIGKIGENLAEQYLLDKGYRLLDKNFRSRCGELDLVFIHDKTLIAAEVKCRKNLKYGRPAEAVTENKKRKLVLSLYSYMAYKKINNLNFRIDVIEVLLNEKDDLIEINHIENAVYL